MKVLIFSQGSYFIRFLKNNYMKFVCDANITQILAIMNSFALADSKYEVILAERDIKKRYFHGDFKKIEQTYFY